MKAFFKKLKYTPHEIADAIVIDLINLYEKINFLYRKFTGKYYSFPIPTRPETIAATCLDLTRMMQASYSPL